MHGNSNICSSCKNANTQCICYQKAYAGHYINIPNGQTPIIFNEPITYIAPKGWECPKCTVVNAPWLPQCPCVKPK
jgi:hypothetical protein